MGNIIKHSVRNYFFILFCILFYVYASISFALSNLISYQYLGEFNVGKAKLALHAMFLDALHPIHSTKLYKINYKTIAPFGKSTQASGLVVMPVNPMGTVSVVGYFHGTRVTPAMRHRIFRKITIFIQPFFLIRAALC